MKCIRHSAFTIVELLIVIAIVAGMVSLMMPAISQAKHAAVVVRCAGAQKQASMAFLIYTESNKTYWPRRNLFTGEKPTHVKWSNATYDWRPLLRTFMPSVNDNLQCPASLRMDIDKSSSTRVESSYAFYAPWQFIGQNAALRRDETFGFGGKQFSLFMGDFLNNQNGSWLIASHPDRQTKLRATFSTSAGDTYTRWENSYQSARGAIDLNFAFTDGSVVTYRNLVDNDPRLTIVTYTNNTTLNTTFLWWVPAP